MAAAKPKGKLVFSSVLGSVGGGFASSILMTQLDKRVPLFTKNKNLAPLANGAAALAVLFFGTEKLHPIAYGMLGATGGDFSNDLVNGLSRIEVSNDAIDGAIDDLEDEIEDLQDLQDEVEEELQDEEAELDEDA